MIPAPAAAPSILTVECGLYAARRLQQSLTAGAAREVPRTRGRGAAATPARLLPTRLLARIPTRRPGHVDVAALQENFESSQPATAGVS